MGEPEKGEKPKKIYTVTHEVQVENDPWYDGTELLTNIKKIPPHNKPYPPNEYSDELRYSNWGALLEETYLTRHRLPKNQQSLIPMK